MEILRIILSSLAFVLRGRRAFLGDFNEFMSAFYVSIMLFLGRAWDAITDPLVGYAVSKSGQTRFGKLIPWIVCSAPMGILSYVMLWYTPRDTMSPVFSFCWYLSWCCLFDAFMSCYHVPYTSLNMFLGGDQRDRDSATGYRMGMEMFGTLAGLVIQGQIVGRYHAKRAETCSMLNGSHTLAGNLSYNFTSPLTDTLQNTRRAYLVAALALGALYFLCCLTLFLGVKEKLAPLSRLERSTVPYLTSLKLLMRHTPYVRLVFGFLFASLAFQGYIPCLIILYFVKDSFPIFAVTGILCGFSLSCLFLLPWSMLPDAVDDFKLKNPSYMDLEPMFYACFVFFNKFGGGVSSGASTLALHFAGYQSGVCMQDPGVVATLQVIFVPVPIILLLIGLVLFYLYPINEEVRQKIKAEIKAAKKQQKLVGAELIWFGELRMPSQQVNWKCSCANSSCVALSNTGYACKAILLSSAPSTLICSHWNLEPLPLAELPPA
ncbi:hypothetical protein P4O66_004572 [Electrophorus voltai]|uniref:Uncharacterized protein n=1 Tax=Electrophorus voltai TaxID=2609070 RepID=A0AAD9E180_9TELE|nr:hypothetical protein P4O66_004572 [Electrophorus voltai]